MNCKIVKTGKAAAFRRTLLSMAVAGCFGVGVALAQPMGPQVINGSVNFATQGNILNITNTPNAIINWQGFSIAPNEVTRFIQQSSGSNVLNRVVGQDSSAILGALQSNGKVYLINPNGILFGPNSRVDVNGLIASTLDISNQDFLAGKYKFSAGTVAGKLDNQGAITTPGGGQIVLIATDVQNSGIITSPKGEILLAAGKSVQLVDTANPDLAIVVSAPENQALNLGQIVGQGGKVGIYGALINQRGKVSADSAVVGENGKIVFKASKDTLLEAGSVTSATGAGKGGEIQVLGERVGLTGDAKVDASGQTGGGTVLIGGDYQGKNSVVQNARATYVGKDAQVKADSIQDGDGGKVIVWADDVTRYYGNISARGGATRGNGGFAEVSGKLSLVYRGNADLRAPYGSQGALLLDPKNITIQSSGADSLASNDQFGENSTATATMDPSFVVNALNGADVILQASNDITVATTSPIDASGNGSNGNLTLQAGRSVVIDSSITTKGSITIIANEKLAQGVVDAQRDAGNAVISTTAALNSSGNAITLTLEDGAGKTNSENGSISIGAGISSGGGNVTITTKQLSNGGDIVISNAGSISAANVAAGTVLLTAAKGITASGPISSVGSSEGVIKLKATGGNILLNDDLADINAGGVSGKVELDASGGIQGAQAAIVFADELVLKSGGTINGTGAWPFSTSINKLDVTSGTGVVSIFNATSKALTLMDLETDTGAGGYGYAVKLPAHASVSTINVTDANMTVSSPILVTGAGDFELRLTSTDTAARTMTIDSDVAQTGAGGRVRLFSTGWGVGAPTNSHIMQINSGKTVSAPNGEVLLDFYNVNQQGVVSAKAVRYTTQAMGVTGTTAATGTTSPSSGIHISPFITNSSLVLANGGVFDPAQIGQFTTSYVDFASNGTGSVQVDSSMTAPANTGLVFKASSGSIAVNNDISALGVEFDTGTLTINAAKSVTTSGPGTAMYDGMRFRNSASLISVGGTGGLEIDPTKLGAPGDTGKNYYANAYHFDSAASSVVVNTALNIPSSRLLITAPSITLGADVTAKGVVYQTNSFTPSTFVTTSSATEGWVAIGPLLNTKAITIAATDPANGSLWVDSDMLGNIHSPSLTFGISDSAGVPQGSGAIAVNGAIAGTAGSFHSLSLITSGNITQTAAITLPANGGGCTDCGGLKVQGAVVTLDNLSNSVDKLTGSTTGALSFTNFKTLYAGDIKTTSGNVTLAAPEPGSDIYITTPGIDSCYGMTSGCTSSVTLSAYGSIYAPLVRAGSVVNLYAGGNVVDTDGGLNNIVSGNGTSIDLYYSVTGNVDLDAWGATIHTGSAAASANIRLSQPVSGGGTAPLPPPTLDACVANPSAAGCSAVLPTLDACAANPSTAGCSAVLPTLDACTSNPSAAGCSAVLPTLDACAANPSAAGCSAVLPTISTCTSNPSAAGCSAVLPTLNTCTANPSAAGCSAVLPTISTCTSTPSAAGCSAVLPTLDACAANPSAAGCSAVLPTLSACTLNPSAAGCSAVLPTLDACTANPSAAGCSAVLPTKLPDVIKEVTKTDESKTLDQTINQTNNSLNNAAMTSVVKPLTTAALLSAPKEASGEAAGGGAGAGEAPGRTAGSEKQDDKAADEKKDDDKKDDKKKDTTAQKEDKKDDAPKKKQYCN